MGLPGHDCPVYELLLWSWLFAAHICSIPLQMGKKAEECWFPGYFVSREHFACCVKEYLFAVIKIQLEQQGERR